MFDRAKIIDTTFRNFLTNKSDVGNFSFAGKHSPVKIIDIFESQLTSRLLDIKGNSF